MKDIKLNLKQYYSRFKILTQSYNFKLNHIPSAFSMIDYFSEFMDNYYPINAEKIKFFIGKNYGSVVYYNTILNDSDIIPTSVITKNEINLFGNKIVFTDDTLCNSFGVAAGYALKNKDKIIIINSGDAALYNGLTYETLIFISKYKIDNLILFVDKNERGVTMPLVGIDIESIFKTMGWKVFDVKGHDLKSIHNVYKNNIYTDYGKPKCFFFNTKKGFGIEDFMTDYKWHGKTLTESDYEKYLLELYNNVDSKFRKNIFKNK